MNRTADELAIVDLLHRLADHAQTEPGPAIALDPVVSHLRSSPGRRWPAAMAAGLLIVVSIAGASVALRRDEERRVVAGGELAPLPAGRTEPLAATSLAGRAEASSVWTGKEVLIWGGTTGPVPATSAGAALDPRANRWRALPPAPFGPRGGSSAVWTGTEMLVWGGGANDQLAADGAAFDPETNRWRTIPASPFGGSSRPAVTWTGTEMLVVSTAGSEYVTVAYNPRTNGWRRLADPPGALVMPYPQIVWTGSQAVLVLWPYPPIPSPGSGIVSPAIQGSGPGPSVGPSSPPPAGPTVGPSSPPATGSPEPSGVPTGPPPVPSFAGPNSSMFIAAFSPELDRWTRLPATPLKDGSLPQLLWTGRELLVMQRSLPSAAFDFGRQTWRSLAAVSQLPAADPVWTGRWVLYWAGGQDGLAYDVRTNTWSTFDAGGLSPRYQAAVVWADGFLIGWGGFASDASGRFENDGIRYRPPSG